MAKMVVMDEFHVTVLVPAGLSRTEYAPIRRTLNNKRFRARLHKAVNSVFRQHSPLKLVKFRISR